MCIIYYIRPITYVKLHTYMHMSIFMNVFLLFQIFDDVTVGFHLKRQILGETFEEDLFSESSFAKKKKTLFFHFLFIFHKFKIHLKFQSDYLIYEYVFTYFRLLRYVQIYITICQCKRIYCFALISRGNIYHVRTGFSCLSARNALIPCDYIYPLSSQAFRQLSALRDTFYIA